MAKVKLLKDLKLRENKIILEGTELDTRYYTSEGIEKLVAGGYINIDGKKKSTKTKKVNKDGDDNINNIQ